MPVLRLVLLADPSFTPRYAPTEGGSAASVGSSVCVCGGSAASKGLSPVTPTSVRTAVESSDSGAASDGPWTDNTNFPVAFLSSADAQALVDSYAADPSLPRWQRIPMFERSTHVHLPSSTSTFVVRTDACGHGNEKQNIRY